MRIVAAAPVLVAAALLLTPTPAYGHYLNSPTNRNEAGNPQTNGTLVRPQDSQERALADVAAPSGSRPPLGGPVLSPVLVAKDKRSVPPEVSNLRGHLGPDLATSPEGTRASFMSFRDFLIVPLVAGHQLFSATQKALEVESYKSSTISRPSSRSLLSSVSRDWIRPNLNLPPVPPVVGQGSTSPRPLSEAPAAAGRVASRGGVVVSGEGSATPLTPLQLKIRWYESRDNYRAQNSASTASGGFQFLDTTWHSNSGLPGHAKDYPQAVQDRVFLLVFSEQGTRPWLSSMSCWG